MSDKSSAPFLDSGRLSYKTRQPLSSDASPTRSTKEPIDTSDNLLSYYSSPIANEGRGHSRPLSPEKPLTNLPSNNNHAKKISNASSSSSSSDYSDDSEVPDARVITSKPSSSVTKRQTAPSKGGADKRRIAIVQMDSFSDRTHKSISDTASSHSARSIRAHNNLSDLALVAPPDAALKSYTSFTPPSSAPVAVDYMSHSYFTAHQDKGQHRAASENPLDRDHVLSRDTGSVGLRSAADPFSSANNGHTRNTKDKDKNNYISSGLDVLQRETSSRSPSPAKHSSTAARGPSPLSPFDLTPMSARTMSPTQAVTPSIGEGKDIHVPVAGPVVVKLDGLPSRTGYSTWRSDSPTPSHGAASNHGSSYSTSATSSYLHYEPGVHSTAGPLPPPPRAMFNIDINTPPPPRPPRLHSPTPTPTNSRIRGDIEAVKQALQLPPSVNAALASRFSTPAPEEPSSMHEETKEKEEKAGQLEKDVVPEKQTTKSNDQEHSRTQSVHKREGATLSSSTSSSEASSELSPDEKMSSKTSADESEDVPPVTVVPPPRSSSAIPASTPVDHSKFDKWLEGNPQFSQSLDARRSSSFDERRESPERSLSPVEGGSEAPSPPPKSLRNSFTNNLKRFSALPRTPSMSSKSGHRLSSSTRYSSRTPSPSIQLSPRPIFKKIRSLNPPALFCHEVYAQNTTLQRCAIYAAKINELYIHDCGLMEWVDDSKTRGQSNHTQRGPSTQPFTPQPRQTSRSSMISDATFPIRPDASVATDLSQGAYRDITPPGGVPSLPYPSLAMNPPAHVLPTRSHSSAGSNTTSSIRSLASTPSIKGGFFATLGRKTSISSGRKDKFLPTISNPVPVSMGLAGRTGSKHSSHTSAPFPRPNNIANPPSVVPGGPRALPNRAQRSQTFMASGSAVSSRSGHEDLARRPSLFNLTLDTVADTQTDSEFSQQVDKLHALIPHADRDILAGYLRRAGQDMLAIGQYLEDERMGTIQRF